MQSAQKSKTNGDTSLFLMKDIPQYWSPALKIGSGAFGEVMLVHSDRLDARGEQILHNEFALKVIRFPECDYHKIIREVNTHTLCRHHDNVLFIGSIYCQTFQQGLRVQMCLEYAALSDLSLLASSETFESHVAYICKNLISALIHIHNLGIVHGDLSVKNILMTHEGVVKLSDFGMANTFEQTRKSKNQSILGTPGFIAPEIINLQGYDGKADLWGLGILSLFLLKGENPFKKCTQFDLESYKVSISESFYPDYSNYSTPLQEFMSSLKDYNPEFRSSALHASSQTYLKTSCSQSEILNYYKRLRRTRGMDLPWPEEIHTFSVPVSLE
ncbi:Putative tyrosine-protein kinase C03B1.5 [Caenorhabditis elegans]|uniref:Putative tyrosine-protein kinase C03B1.5 n=1 Tax=Caenorhabditis elegans TaxID=6239 RepID=YX05_CAEEL|nr:Putative tyrosine-protein kinase C03B1.5 [Caenorhabditis elegans]Q11112.3 RecName: Full=Putative tyrosine-protein kinase C03B1.5 [Caenorhabditis elegans]CCD62741.1 Putative tyrosine-protein kinase C03B1.5 [Caenorhabditis elegans]|eukprot:NP_509065.2 Putative tyrosine-protein kinase C03B1.5 [Caenorhabditis elegans]